MDRHRAARAELVMAGVPADLIETFNLAALSYSAWQQQHPELSAGGLLPELTDTQEQALHHGQLLLTLAYAAQAVSWQRLTRPIAGRWSTVAFRLCCRRYPTPGGYGPVGATDGGPRFWLSQMHSLSKG